MRSRSLVRATAVLIVASGLSLVSTASLAATNGPTQAQLNALVSAESNVATLAKHYRSSPAWAAQFRAAEAKQSAVLAEVNASLTPTSTPTTAAAQSATIDVEPTELFDPGAIYLVDITTEPDGLTPAPRTIRVTLVDTATGKLIASWMDGPYSALLGDPALVLQWSNSGGSTGTLTVDAAVGTPWYGPASVNVTSADLLNDYVGVWAAFLGQPGFAPSKSSTALLG